MTERKCALVTGAGRGLGKAIALGLAAEGYDVGVNYNASEEKAQAVCAEIEAMGRRAVPIRADVGDLRDIDAMFDAFLETFGRIDVLVNNAGVNSHRTISETTPELFEQVVNIDFRGTFFCTRRAAMFMQEHGIAGSIVNISSCQHEIAFPTSPVYGPIKSAITNFTRYAAMEWAGCGIRVNSISPGHIKVIDGPAKNREKEQTRRVPMGRVGQPREIADAVLFLISDNASYITGADLKVDGGVVIPCLLNNNLYPLPPIGT